jgi:hypothetical protein
MPALALMPESNFEVMGKQSGSLDVSGSCVSP